jgi:hypothetical protein
MRWIFLLALTSAFVFVKPARVTAGFILLQIIAVARWASFAVPEQGS